MNSEEVVMPDESLAESMDLPQQSNTQKRKREGPYRGPGRALKYKKLRKTQPARIQIEIPEELGAVVGDKALQFIAECSDWVKEICPLNVTKWEKMPPDAIDRLYKRIKAKYMLPEEEYVQKALRIQCANLYRHWRERLKKKYFANNNCLRVVVQNCPSGIDVEQWKWLVYNYWSCPKQRERSEKNKANAQSMKIHSASGAKSTLRIIHEMNCEIESAEMIEANSDEQTQLNMSTEPKYIQLWIKTKRHADGRMDDEAENILQKFRDLHSKEIEEKGSDELTIDQAYGIVLGNAIGYARGLGRAHPMQSKKMNLWRSELQTEVELLREREKELRAEIGKKKNKKLWRKKLR